VVSGRSQVDIDVPSGVVIYRDGTPTLAGYFQNEPYFDMESIEVYRGPQGTFVGQERRGRRRVHQHQRSAPR
jgi:iron complex outermembrane receptor protein